MNERIRELMEQAGLHDFVVESMGIDEEMNKFAELIIRECAGVAEVSMPINSYPDDRLMVKNNVLKHFGVES